MKTKMKGNFILVEISIGELIDKIAILQIKSQRIKDEKKLENVNRELNILNHIRARGVENTPELFGLEAELKRINEVIWNLEDDVREHEYRKDFGASFVSLARSVYKINDERSMVKRRINDLMGSNIIEEKSYHRY